MWLVLGVMVAAAPLAALIYLATLNGKFRLKRSLKIEASADLVFATIIDLKSWPEWSPWLMHEPGTRLSYSENYQAEGGYYSWDGERVGAGKVSHVSINPVTSIKQQIEFLRPFKSINTINWGFETSDRHCIVSWEMSGSLPFLFRFMTRKTEAMIGRDYELGLALLNGYMNATAAHPELAFIGREDLEDFSYWAIPCNGNLRQLETARRSGIETLRGTEAGTAGLALMLYHRFDPDASQFQTEIAIPISNNTPQSNYIQREFTGGRYFQMTLHGDHQFLPLAWYALRSHCRIHKIKFDKRRPALEIYHDDPSKVSDSNQIATSLYLPIK